MTRKEFLNIGFWITDFITFKRGFSTEHFEGVHIFSERTGKQFNIFWENETISVAIYDTTEPNKFKKNTIIIESLTTITEKQIEELYEKYLY